MRSSECTYISRGGSGPVFLTCVAIANALFGGLLFVVAVAVLLEPRGDRTWSVTTAVLVAAGAAGWSAQAAGFHRMYVHRVPQDGCRVVATTVDGAPAVVLNWRTAYLRIPLATLGLVVALVPPPPGAVRVPAARALGRHPRAGARRRPARAGGRGAVLRPEPARPRRAGR